MSGVLQVFISLHSNVTTKTWLASVYKTQFQAQHAVDHGREISTVCTVYSVLRLVSHWHNTL